MFFIAKPSMVMSSRFVPNKRGIFLLENLSFSFSLSFISLYLPYSSFSCYISISIDRQSHLLTLNQLSVNLVYLKICKKELIEIIWSMIRQMFVHDKYN